MRKSILFLALAALVSCENLPRSKAGNNAGKDADTATQKPLDKEAIKKIVMAMEDTLEMAYNQRNASLFEKFYGKGATTYGEGREQLFGKKEIIGHFRRNVVADSNFSESYKYHTLDVLTSGDMAVESGRWEEFDTSGTQVDHGFYMVVFQKQNGQYKSIRDIWNSATAENKKDQAEEIESDDYE